MYSWSGINGSASMGEHLENTKTNGNTQKKVELDELMELADYNIRLWMDLKDTIRKFVISSPKIFNGEILR